MARRLALVSPLLLLLIKAEALATVGGAAAGEVTSPSSGDHSAVLIAIIGLGGIALTTLGGILGPILLEHYRGGSHEDKPSSRRRPASVLTQRLRVEVEARQTAEAHAAELSGQLDEAHERIVSLERSVERLTEKLAAPKTRRRSSA